MSDGEISANTVTANSNMETCGGGVYVYGNASFAKTGGTIYGYPAYPGDKANTVWSVPRAEGGSIETNLGSAVFVPDEPLQKEKTAGPNNPLSYNYPNIDDIDGDWDFYQ
jgi:hypothetical protein